jgi:hypothetical protein
MPEFARNIGHDGDDSKNLPDIVSVRVGRNRVEREFVRIRQGVMFYFQVCTDPLVVGIFLSRRPLELRHRLTISAWIQIFWEWIS